VSIAGDIPHSTRLPPWRKAGSASQRTWGTRRQIENAAPDNDSSVLAVLSLLSDESNRGRELRPTQKTGYGGVVYDLGSGIEISYDKLKISEKKGLLTVSGYLAFSTCSKCEDLSLQTQLFCPECSSQDLLKSDLLIHYECQTTGPVGEFQSTVRNGYYCKRCRKELKRVGIDYGNPGIGFKCRECEKVFQFPLVLSRCSSGHTSKIDEINLKSFPKYVIGGNAEGLSNLLIDSQTLKTHLEKRDIKSKMLASLMGSSGTYHVVPLLLTLPGSQEGENIALEFVNDDANIEKSMLQLLMKSADLEKLRMIIIHRGEADAIEQIRSVVNPKKVRVLSASGNSDDLADRILREATAW
jgi:hypothetical protein